MIIMTIIIRHIGIQIRSALVTAIYQKSLVVDLTATAESIGQLNNLISVDAGEIQSFCAYSHAIWSEAMEVGIGCTLLLMVLGTATIGGIIVMFLCIVLGLYMSKLCENYQETLMKSKDGRMGIISEVLNVSIHGRLFCRTSYHTLHYTSSYHTIHSYHTSHHHIIRHHIIISFVIISYVTS